MADTLSFLKIPVVFSINENQLTSYSNHIPLNDLVVDGSEVNGPARGILTVHSRFPGNDILLVACDMLELDQYTISNIIQAYTIEDHFDFYVYQDEEYAQPFCGIYTGRGIDKLRVDILSKSFTNVSMQYILNNGDTKRIPIEHKKAFANFNFSPMS